MVLVDALPGVLLDDLVAELACTDRAAFFRDDEAEVGALGARPFIQVKACSEMFGAACEETDNELILSSS